MNESKMKNIVVLRNIASNIVDEAIVFVKPNIKVPITNNIANSQEEYQEFQDNFIINEAKLIIENYKSEIEGKDKNKEIELKKKNKIFKRANIILFILTCILIIF